MLLKTKIFRRSVIQRKFAVLIGFFDAILTKVFGQSEINAFDRRKEFERQN
jgi:hypothetical protein